MNKALSFTMVLIMLLGMIPTVFADEIADALDNSVQIDTTDAAVTEDGVINTESDNGFIRYLDSYSTGSTSEDGGVAEIVKYNADNGCMYLVSGYTQTLDIVKLNSDGSAELVKKVDIGALGEANGRVYAVIGLERVGGMMVYDITDPENAVYADYLNVRDFTEDDLTAAGDLGPEGICIVPAEESPTGEILVLAANEISGTVTAAQLGAEESAKCVYPVTWSPLWRTITGGHLLG